MQKIKIKFLILVLISLISFGVFVTAQEIQKVQEIVPLAPETLPELPSPGLKYGDFFHFLDRWGEVIQEIFTFSPEAKAILQTKFTLERIAEIKATLKEKGIEAPGLAIAEEKIRQNMEKAANILERQRARGIEVAQLAKNLDKEFNARQSLLREAFKAARENLKAEEKALRDQIKEARLIENFERVDELRTALIDIEAQKNRIDNRKDLLREMFETEKERIKVKMEAREREISELAEKAEVLFEQKERKAELIIRQKERVLEMQEKALEIQLRQAILARDTALVDQIKTQFLDIKTQEQVIEKEEEALEKGLEQEKNKLKKAVTMRERAVEQIKEAKEKIIEVKEEKIELEETPELVLRLIQEAESKLIIAEQAFEAENYGKAFGQAMAAEMLARNAKRILNEKEEAIEKLEEIKEEIKEVREKYQEEIREIKERVREKREKREERVRERERREERRVLCKADADCVGFVCPMMIGQDTPQCGPEGICICGPGRNLEEMQERPVPRIPEIPEMPGSPERRI
jgi:hypothetical protein